jgi:adenosylhomocysteine nucleosidase
MALMLAIVATVPTRAGTVAVLAALDSELEMLKKEVEVVGQPLEFNGRSIYQARFEGKPILLAKTGSSPDAVAPLIRWLVNDRNVGAVISIGPAGGLSDSVEIGDVVMAGKAVRDGGSPAQGTWALTQITNCETKRVGTLVTVDSFVASQGERLRLHGVFGADVVDMSAAVIAGVCASRHLPCVIIRQITDRADENAPRSFAEAVRTKRPPTIPTALCVLAQLAGRLASKGAS